MKQKITLCGGDMIIARESETEGNKTFKVVMSNCNAFKKGDHVMRTNNNKSIYMNIHVNDQWCKLVDACDYQKIKKNKKQKIYLQNSRILTEFIQELEGEVELHVVRMSNSTNFKEGDLIKLKANYKKNEPDLFDLCRGIYINDKFCRIYLAEMFEIYEKKAE